MFHSLLVARCSLLVGRGDKVNSADDHLTGVTSVVSHDDDVRVKSKVNTPVMGCQRSQLRSYLISLCLDWRERIAERISSNQSDYLERLRTNRSLDQNTQARISNY